MQFHFVTLSKTVTANSLKFILGISLHPILKIFSRLSALAEYRALSATAFSVRLVRGAPAGPHFQAPCSPYSGLSLSCGGLGELGRPGAGPWNAGEMWSFGILD